MRKFCGVCGEKLVNSSGKAILEQFNSETGERKSSDEINAGYLACPSGRCGHWGIDHKWQHPNLIAMIFGNNIARCSRCGVKREMYDGL